MSITLTKRAVAIITIVVGQRPAASDGGLRLSSGKGEITVAFVPHRSPFDEVIEQGGARVFLDPAVSEQLAGKILDGRVDDAGSPSFDVISRT